MTASCGIRTAVAGVRSPAPGIMNMIGNRLHVLINVWVEMLPSLALISRPLNDVKQMRYYTGLDKTLPTLVKVDPPRIARAFGEHFELAFGGMKSPDAGIDLHAFVIRNPRFAYLGMREHAMTSVEPA